MTFGLWAAENLWPFIKHYSFAGALKEICNGLFDLDNAQCYGTDQEKNTLTWFRWQDMPGYEGDEEGRMTAREFMQFLVQTFVVKSIQRFGLNTHSRVFALRSL